MAKFRKRPVVIEAVTAASLLKSAAEAWGDLPAWAVDAYERGDLIFAAGVIMVGTLEGTMRAEAGDWVIRGVAGEIYPCKPEIFDATYEPADD